MKFWIANSDWYGVKASLTKPSPLRDSGGPYEYKEVSTTEYLEYILKQKINEKKVLTILTNKLDRYRNWLPATALTQWDSIYSKLVDCIVKELEEIPTESITFTQLELRTFKYLMDELNKESPFVYQDFFQLLIAGYTINQDDKTKYQALASLFGAFQMPRNQDTDKIV